MGAGAVVNFFHQMLYGIWQAMPMVLLLLAPAVVTIVLAAKGKFALPKLQWFRPAQPWRPLCCSTSAPWR